MTAPPPEGGDTDSDLAALKARAEAGLTRALAFTRGGARVRLLADAAGLYHGFVYAPAPGGGWRVSRALAGAEIGPALDWLSATAAGLGGVSPAPRSRATRKKSPGGPSHEPGRQQPE